MCVCMRKENDTETEREREAEGEAESFWRPSQHLPFWLWPNQILSG